MSGPVLPEKYKELTVPPTVPGVIFRLCPASGLLLSFLRQPVGPIPEKTLIKMVINAKSIFLQPINKT